MTQRQLGDAMGKAQTWISQLENPDYGKMSVTTLLRLAEEFDTDLEIKFRPFSTTINTLPDQGPEYFTVPGFEEEKSAIEANLAHEEAAVKTQSTVSLAGMGSSSEHRAQFEHWYEAGCEAFGTYLQVTGKLSDPPFGMYGRLSGLYIPSYSFANPNTSLSSSAIASSSQQKGVEIPTEDDPYRGLRLLPKPTKIIGMNPPSKPIKDAAA